MSNMSRQKTAFTTEGVSCCSRSPLTSTAEAAPRALGSLSLSLSLSLFRSLSLSLSLPLFLSMYMKLIKKINIYIYIYTKQSYVDVCLHLLNDMHSNHMGSCQRTSFVAAPAHFAACIDACVRTPAWEFGFDSCLHGSFRQNCDAEHNHGSHAADPYQRHQGPQVHGNPFDHKARNSPTHTPPSEKRHQWASEDSQSGLSWWGCIRAGGIP